MNFNRRGTTISSQSFGLMKGNAAFSIILSMTIISTAVFGGSIDDVKHVVIFMQENRAFDHYFGTLKGVRGSNDRCSVPLAADKNVFYQPVNSDYENDYMLPFRVDPEKSNAM